MIQEQPPIAALDPLRPHPPRPPRRSGWRRPRLLLAGLVVLLALGVLVSVVRSRQTPPPAPAAVAAPLVAHGQVLPAQQAHVGTQTGGVVQQLTVNVGDQVQAQAPLAWVLGPSGTEVVTAPFAGTVTNVLVHTGDTLLPGAGIAVVADLHSLQVETSDVDEFLISHVQVGQDVQVTVDALNDEAISGRISRVALLPETAAGGTQTYPVTITLSSVPPDVRAGMSVRLTLPD